MSSTGLYSQFESAHAAMNGNPALLHTSGKFISHCMTRGEILDESLYGKMAYMCVSWCELALKALGECLV